MPLKDRQELYAYQRRHREANKERIYEYLLVHPCVDCGESDPIVLEFDHVRGTKKKNVSRMACGSTYSWTAIKIEIDKCDIRCANCHRRRHHLESIH